MHLSDGRLQVPIKDGVMVRIVLLLVHHVPKRASRNYDRRRYELSEIHEESVLSKTYEIDKV